MRPHPCAGIKRDNRLAVARLLRELDLDADAGTAGPPAIFANREVRHAHGEDA